MKKLILLLLIPILGLIISACNSEDNPTTPVETKGSIYITSNPAGAQIWIDGINTSQTTPDTVNDVTEGVRNITLKLTDYKDTTFTLSVTAGQMSVVGPINLVSDIFTVFYGGQPIRIYETAGTDTTQPSGLDLSSGTRYGITSSQKGLVDIYYSSNGYLVQSADLYPGLIRVTKFFV
ncbi:MAG: PEGA domain-containing protein, partial [Ignavibacteriaceae bacterium]|nr:PEGA domain-containing protein [Ignavibacteriaceae bacterium]